MTPMLNITTMLFQIIVTSEPAIFPSSFTYCSIVGINKVCLCELIPFQKTFVEWAITGEPDYNEVTKLTVFGSDESSSTALHLFG